VFLAERNSSGDHILGGLDHGQIWGGRVPSKEAENQNHRATSGSCTYIFVCLASKPFVQVSRWLLALRHRQRSVLPSSIKE